MNFMDSFLLFSGNRRAEIQIKISSGIGMDHGIAYGQKTLVTYKWLFGLVASISLFTPNLQFEHFLCVKWHFAVEIDVMLGSSPNKIDTPSPPNSIYIWTENKEATDDENS